MLHVSPSPEPSLVPGPAVNPHSHVHPHAGHFNISAGGSNTVNTGNSLTSNNKACGVGNLGSNNINSSSFDDESILQKSPPAPGTIIGYWGVASYDPADNIVIPIVQGKEEDCKKAIASYQANLAKKNQANPRTQATITPAKPTKSIPKKQDDYTPHGSDDRSESTPCVNDGPDNYVFPAALHRLTGWFTGRTAREKKEKEAAERSRIAMGRYRARIAYENERKTAAFSALSNLQENNTRLGALFSPAKTIPYKAPDQPSSHSGDSQHLYLSDEGRARLLENQLIRMYGKKAVDELIRKNIELDDARAERENTERKRDLVLAERSRARYELGFEGKIPCLTPQEQAFIDKSLADIPENIVDLAGQAAQKVEDLKRSHPFYQEPNPPRSPNEASRTKAAFDLRAYQDAEKKKADEVERLDKSRREAEERREDEDRRDRRSGKKLVMQLTQGILSLGNVVKGENFKISGWPFPPAGNGTATMHGNPDVHINLSAVYASVRRLGASIGSLFYRDTPASAGSGGSRTPEEPEVKEQENKTNGRKVNTTSKSDFFGNPLIKNNYEYYKEGVYKLKHKGAGLGKAEYLKWDHLHNDVEVWCARGRHLGSIDPLTKNIYKGPQGHKLWS